MGSYSWLACISRCGTAQASIQFHDQPPLHRPHRTYELEIGQTKAVISLKLIARGTVEEKILALQKRKRELAQGVLGGEADLAKGLTEQDVRELFEG